MRIAYLSASQVPSRYANSIRVMNMCEAFAALGHEVTLFARVGDEPADDIFRYYGVRPLFQLVRCRKPARLGALGRAWYRRSAMRLLRKSPLPGFCYGSEPFMLLSAAARGIPVSLEAHAPPETIWKHRAQAQLFRRPGFRRAIVVSRALRQEYLRRFPRLAPDKLIVVPNGTALPERVEPSTVNGHWGGRPGRVQVGYVGHLYPGKGMEVLIPLARRMPELDFHVAGGRPEELAHWQGEACGVDNLSLHGHLAPGQTGAFRLAMDVLLAPYQWRVTFADGGTGTQEWGSPLKLLEYLATGRAIVASNLPVVREILSPDRNALLVPPDDLDAWVGAIRRLAGDAALRQRLAAQAFLDAKEQFTWEARAKRVLEGVAGS